MLALKGELLPVAALVEIMMMNLVQLVGRRQAPEGPAMVVVRFGLVGTHQESD